LSADVVLMLHVAHVVSLCMYMFRWNCRVRYRLFTVVGAQHALAISQGRIRAGGGRSPLPQEGLKIFLNASENKSSDRKLTYTLWYSLKRFRHYAQCINSAASGGGASPQPPAGTLPPAHPLRTLPQTPASPSSSPLARTSGSATAMSSALHALTVSSVLCVG